MTAVPSTYIVGVASGVLTRTPMQQGMRIVAVVVLEYAFNLGTDHHFLLWIAQEIADDPDITGARDLHQHDNIWTLFF